MGNGGFGMKTKLLGLIVAVAMCGPWPATASTYTYEVSIDIAGVAITGTIVTSCDSCALLNSDILSWSFNGSDGGSFSSGAAGASYTTSVAPALVASPTEVVYSIAQPSGSYSAFCGAAFPCASLLLEFDVQLAGGYGYDHYYDPAIGTYSNEKTETDIQLAAISSTPLPAALPLFASGLGALGLLGWRRKRKNVAALAA